jgi:hypothetical protein
LDPMSTTVPTASCPGINCLVSYEPGIVGWRTNGELGNEFSLVDVGIGTTDTTNVDCGVSSHQDKEKVAQLTYP